MKTKLMKTKILLLLCICVAMAGCKDEENPEVKDFIIGKWQLVKQGPTEDELQPVEASGGYTEFFGDGKIADYNTQTYTKHSDRVFKMDDTHLFIEFDRKIYGTENDREYEYQYNDSSQQLTLGFIKGIIEDKYPQPLITVYQRIK